MSWYDQVLPLAQQASKATGLPVSSILAQWALETGRGSSPLAAENNLAGIKYTGNPGSREGGGGHAVYNDPADFLADYARVLHLSFYDHVRAAAARGPEAVIRAFTSSPPGVPRYAEDPSYSTKLLDILRADNLTRYDQAGQVAATQVDGGIHLTPVGGSLPANLSAGALAAIAAVAGTILLLVISSD